MYEIDFARGFAYRGNMGFIIRLNPKGLYVKDGSKEVQLTPENAKVMEVANESINI